MQDLQIRLSTTGVLRRVCTGRVTGERECRICFTIHEVYDPSGKFVKGVVDWSMERQLHYGYKVYVRFWRLKHNHCLLFFFFSIDHPRLHCRVG